MESLRREVATDVDLIRDADFTAGPAFVAISSYSKKWRLLRLWWEQRRILYRTAIWGVAVSAIFAFLIPKRYESTETIMPPEPTASNGMMMAAFAAKASPELAATAANLFGMKNTGALFAFLLHSRTIEEHIVDRFALMTVYGVRYKEDARKILDGRTAIEEERKSGVISISVTDSRPQRARDIAQAYVEELNRLVSQVSTSSAHRERVFIEQRLSAVKGDLEDAEQQFSNFASKNTTLDIKEQTKAMVESAAVMQGQLMAAQSELEGLRQIFSSNNYRVRSLQARVDELKRQLEKIEGTDASLTSDVNQGGELYPSIRKLPILGVQWADLYRRTKIQETVYELLNQQYELARIQEAKEVPTVNVIDSANLPEKKSYPPRLRIIIFLTSGALVVAFCCITLKSQVNQLEPHDPRRLVFTSIGKRIRSWSMVLGVSKRHRHSSK